jgi:hypothetical protein
MAAIARSARSGTTRRVEADYADWVAVHTSEAARRAAYGMLVAFPTQKLMDRFIDGDDTKLVFSRLRIPQVPHETRICDMAVAMDLVARQTLDKPYARLVAAAAAGAPLSGPLL